MEKTLYKLQGPLKRPMRSARYGSQKNLLNIRGPRSIAPILACRLISLNKNPGVRQIGIGDTARRIMAKSITHLLKSDIQEASGCQLSGIEAAVHATRTAFKEYQTDAFNSLNRHLTLHNLRRTCLINTYKEPTELYVDGDTIPSQGGITHDNPLAMTIYSRFHLSDNLKVIVNKSGMLTTQQR